MLVYFRVGNYKSIKDPIVLNFNAAAIGEHMEANVMREQSASLLKSILLYGANGSGKSKILDAFAFFRWFIVNSATDRHANEPIDVESFELSETTEDKPSYFEMAFVLNGRRYRYGFEVDREKIHKEWLLEAKVIKENPVFLRIGNQFEIEGKRFENAKDLDKRTRKNALFLSVASQWNVKKAEEISEWFSRIFTIHGMSDDLYKNITHELLKDERYSKQVQEFMQKADLGIDHLELTRALLYRKTLPNTPDNVKKEILTDDYPTVFTFHKKFDAEGKEVGNVRFFLDEQESEGTKKYFNLIGVFIKAIAENRIVVIDEFDARLHPLLTKAILQLFNSSNTGSKAQLLAATHDTTLLDNSILRRDQIYFVEKDRFGASQAVSLVEYKTRKESPFDKNYLEGKYGAIPFIGGFETSIKNG